MFTLPTQDRSSGLLLLPFHISSAIESLPVFCSSGQQASVLSYLTRFLVDDYHLEIRVAPSTLQSGPSNVILANQQYEDQISIPTGSFLMMVGGRSTASTHGTFRVRWYNSGSQSECTDDFVNEQMISGRFSQLPQTGTGMLDGTTLVSSNSDKNLFILPSPLSITSPGQLNISIVNLSQSTQTIEMAFYFAVPNGTSNQAIQAAAISNATKR